MLVVAINKECNCPILNGSSPMDYELAALKQRQDSIQGLTIPMNSLNVLCQLVCLHPGNSIKPP